MNIDKRQNNSLKVFYSNDSYDLVFDNKLYLFLFRKAERIVAALYILTENFNKEEPLKWTIRQEASSIIKDILIIIKNPTNQGTQVLKDITNRLLSISSYLSISSVSGLISSMNLDIMQNEIKNIISSISHEVIKRPNVDARIARDFFGGDIKDIKDIKKDMVNVKVDRFIIKDHVTGLSKEGGSKDGQGNKVSGDKRQQSIIEILQGNDHVSIKDIVDKIQDCSEKTIQRDLINMIEKGLVVREGERRWSKYSLKR